MSERNNIFLTGNPGVGKSTCIIKVVEALQNKLPNLKISGFYTEECRESGQRTGFDIVSWKDPKTFERVPLARVGPQKPTVGKYSVCVDNIQNVAIESLQLTSRDKELTLQVIDEVGKMELLCRDFFPAVELALDTVRPPSVVIGTVPLPRRPIREVDKIKSRSDVLVLQVTQFNRNQLTADLITSLLAKMEGLVEQPLEETLASYVATSSQEPPDGRRKNNDGSAQRISLAQPKPCGPLVSSSIEPKLLLMGETASPQPEETGMEYSERSMWNILSRMVGLSIHKDSESYQILKDATLGKGIAIWDVLANVHDRKNKRRRGEQLNDLKSFVEKHPSISAFCFIGARARKTFGKHFSADTNNREITISSRSIRLVVLPSSSTSNNHVSVEEKIAQWKASMEEFLTG